MKRLSFITMLFSIILCLFDYNGNLWNRVPQITVKQNLGSGIEGLFTIYRYRWSNDDTTAVSKTRIDTQKHSLLDFSYLYLVKPTKGGSTQPPYLFLRRKSLGFPAALGGPTSPSSSINSMILAALL